MLVPGLLGLFFVAVAEPGRSISRTVAHEILAALQDPLALFSQRSPGQRIAGRLLSTKGETGPHERVLSTVRDREAPPAADNLAPLPDTVATIPIIPPQYEVPPTDRTIGPLPFMPPAPFIPTGFIPGGTPNPPLTDAPPNPPGNPNPPGSNPPGPNPPGPNPPPEGPNPPGLPPDSPPPDVPPAIPIPEPSTWTLMLLGFFASVAAGRVRKRKTVSGG